MNNYTAYHLSNEMRLSEVKDGFLEDDLVIFAHIADKRLSKFIP